jgi:hypothetical protein
MNAPYYASLVAADRQRVAGIGVRSAFSRPGMILYRRRQRLIHIHQECRKPCVAASVGKVAQDYRQSLSRLCGYTTPVSRILDCTPPSPRAGTSASLVPRVVIVIMQSQRGGIVGNRESGRRRGWCAQGCRPVTATVCQRVKLDAASGLTRAFAEREERL